MEPAWKLGRLTSKPIAAPGGSRLPSVRWCACSLLVLAFFRITRLCLQLNGKHLPERSTEFHQPTGTAESKGWRQSRQRGPTTTEDPNTILAATSNFRLQDEVRGGAGQLNRPDFNKASFLAFSCTLSAAASLTAHSAGSNLCCPHPSKGTQSRSRAGACPGLKGLSRFRR